MDKETIDTLLQASAVAALTIPFAVVLRSALRVRQRVAAAERDPVESSHELEMQSNWFLTLPEDSYMKYVSEAERYETGAADPKFLQMLEMFRSSQYVGKLIGKSAIRRDVDEARLRGFAYFCYLADRKVSN